MALLFLLPLVGIFLRPLLRLCSVATNSIAAIGSAVLVCVTSCIVLLIQFVTMFVQALRPSRAMLPIVQLAIVAALLVGACRYWALSFSLVVGAAALGLALYALFYYRLWHGMIPGPGVLSRKGARVALCSGVFLCAVWALVYFLHRTQGDLNQCLHNGQIQQACVKRLNATRF